MMKDNIKNCNSSNISSLKEEMHIKMHIILKNNFDSILYKKFFERLSIFSYQENNLILTTASNFIKNWIKRNFLNKNNDKKNKLFTLLTKEFIDIENIDIIYEDANNLLVKNNDNYANNSNKENNKIINLSNNDNIFNFDINLNENFTFDNFVVDEINKLPYSIARSMAEDNNNQLDINLLLFYGSIGTGKTHLSQSIVNYIKINRKDKNILYLSAERFMYYFIKSIRSNKINNFKDNFRNIDYLIIDDIHFLTGKTATQEELLYNIINLTSDNKKVILICDRHPNKLTDIDFRLRSRINGGMVIDFKPIDFQLTFKILQFKLKQHNLHLSDEILNYIANNISKKINFSVRDIEGIVKKILADYLFVKKKIDLNYVTNLIKESNLNTNKSNINKISLLDIRDEICNYFDIDKDTLLSSSKIRKIARPRQVGVYIAKILTDKNLYDIGKIFNIKNHTSLIYSYKKISELTKEDQNLTQDIYNIKDKLLNK